MATHDNRAELRELLAVARTDRDRATHEIDAMQLRSIETTIGGIPITGYASSQSIALFAQWREQYGSVPIEVYRAAMARR